MRRLGPSSEEEMIAVFLGAELTSERFGHGIREYLREQRLPERLVAEPDLTNRVENEERRQLLEATRGYIAKTGLFGGFPADVRWEWAALTVDELRGVRYINWSYWLELSGGSRLPSDAAERIRAGFEPFGVGNAGFFAVADAVAAGARLSPLILVTTGDGGPLVVLEGHVRLTAYMLRPDAAPPEIDAVIGVSPDFVKWSEY